MIIYNGTYCVYAHINKINGKIYIGQTIHGDNPVKRWGHNGVYYKTQPYFYHAIQKWGWDGFDHEVIANHLTAKEADEFEKLLIKKLNTTDNNFGYNLATGGKSCEMTEETKKKISDASRATWKNEDIKKRASEKILAKATLCSAFLLKKEWMMKHINHGESRQLKELGQKNLGK